MEAAVARRAGRHRPAEPDHHPHAHRPRLAEQAGHARGARLAARRGGDPPHQAGLRLAQRGAVLHPRRGAARTSASASTAATSDFETWSQEFEASPHRGRARAHPRRPAAGRLGLRRAQEGPGRGHDRHPQGLQRGHPVGGREGARAGRRLGRPRALDADAHQRRRAASRRGAYGGRNLHFGIREHGMGAIVNGLTLQGFRAFGAGFLIFSDYMKAAIRLAALMRIPSIFVFTHDSIGLGEDGPTHQPIEQLAQLRATPNLDVVRPAGFNETALAWRHALRQTDRPTALRALAPGPAGVGPGRGAGRRDRARRLRPARQRGRRAGADPHGHRLGGPPGARGDQAARGGRASACGS